MVLLLLTRRLTRPPGLNLRTYNICDGRGFGLTQSIHTVNLENSNLMLITETNIPDKECCHNRLGYDVM